MDDDDAEQEEEEEGGQLAIDEDATNCSSGQIEPEIDVTNVSNSNCDLIRHSEDGTEATDLRRRYD